METKIFLDTNTFLHFQSYEEIDWPTVIGANVIKILIAPIVIRELNKHKDSHSIDKIRDRAAASLARIHTTIFENKNQIRHHVTLEALAFDPQIDFPLFHLSKEVQDDVLCASIIEYKQKHSADPIILITNDLGLILKANALQIEQIRLSEKLRLPSGLDENQKKMQRLASELNEVKSKLPSLKILFNNHLELFETELKSDPQVADVALALEEIKKKYPKRETYPKNTVAFFVISGEQILNSNLALDKFYEEYAEYLNKKNEYFKKANLTYALNFILTNEGNIPATDIDIFLHFPDGASVFDDKNLFAEPDQPTPPVEPGQHLFSGLMGHDFVMPRMPSLSSPPLIRNVSNPVIKKTNSYEIRVHVKRLKHKLEEDLPSLYVYFDSLSNVKSFHIDYTINAADMPHEAVGQLHVIIKNSK